MNEQKRMGLVGWLTWLAGLGLLKFALDLSGWRWVAFVAGLALVIETVDRDLRERRP